jgi:hypothetical protein
MKIINIIFIVLFLFFAALQYNDPDPYVWMPIYLYAALLCLLFTMNKYKVWYYIAGLLVYGTYAIYLFFDKDGVLGWIQNHNAESLVQSMEPGKPWIEETREFFGLVILIVVLLINMLAATLRKNKVQRNSGKASLNGPGF